jgi:glycosyltransferase involved in cell wall biosynthesis
MKFCFFGNISSALKGRTIGGGELQISLLAKALAQNGHEVAIIDPSSSETFVTNEGIKLISVPNWNKGFRGVRLFFYRIPALWKLFSEQNADYYYVRMRTYLHLIPFLVSKKLGKQFIQAIAHDLDVLGISAKFKHEYKANFNLIKYLTLNIPNDLVFSYLLKRSDYIILQHSGQLLKRLLVKGKIVIFPNIFDFSNLPKVENPPKDYFVHVGALTVMKGAENLYHLLTNLNEKERIMIIGEPRDFASKAIIESLNNSKNIIIKGRLGHSQTLELIANSKALINTSNYEGFPNVFLEAWGMGVPVISLNVNPGMVFDNRKLGICCHGDFNKMKDYMESDEMVEIDRTKLISYVIEFHDFATAGSRFFNILRTTSPT